MYLNPRYNKLHIRSKQATASYMLRLSASPRCLTTTRDARVRLSSDRLPVGMVTWNVGWVRSCFLVPRGDVGGLGKKESLLLMSITWLARAKTKL